MRGIYNQIFQFLGVEGLIKVFLDIMVWFFKKEAQTYPLYDISVDQPASAGLFYIIQTESDKNL